MSMYPQIVEMDTVVNLMEFAQWMMLGSPSATVMKDLRERIVMVSRIIIGASLSEPHINGTAVHELYIIILAYYLSRGTRGDWLSMISSILDLTVQLSFLLPSKGTGTRLSQLRLTPNRPSLIPGTHRALFGAHRMQHVM